MKKIIVTGGSGFIGSNLVNYLIKKKYFVINIDKLTYSSNKYFNDVRNKKNYKFFRLDINNKNQLIKIIGKFKPSEFLKRMKSEKKKYWFDWSNLRFFNKLFIII